MNVSRNDCPNNVQRENEKEEERENIKSSAIVKYSAVHTPAKYAEIRSNTDLNLPPANWLRKIRGYQGLGGHGTLDVRHRSDFSSFHMANNFPDCIGEVDVVSDAENIKKLLKIPYSKSQVSMLIHRIGKTILVDEFDIHSQLLRTTEKDWDWLRKFYFEHVLQSLKEKGYPRKNKSRYNLQHKSMFSKFLYRSIADIFENCESDGKKSSFETTDPPMLVDQSLPNVRDHVPVSEDEDNSEQRHAFCSDHKFLRDILWTFEDITMLIGTDMPIFGGGTHPCVSLRLREKNKPINILTGLDYWLDNLMCNVPEIMMCYHSNGIVQKYELLKTEDIPQLDNCKFSPKVIKDVAQNILSFLKTNATKAGHTYWLYKGKDDEAVKLYDLTTLCSDNLMEDKGQNPFAIHVAMLFFTLARNLHGQESRSNKKWATIHFLLCKCIRLLEESKTPQLMASAQFLLADLFVPDKNYVKDFKEDEDDSINAADFVLEEPSPSPRLSTENYDTAVHTEDKLLAQKSPSVEVESLCVSQRSRRNTDDNILVEKKLSKDLAERCRVALAHILKGLSCISQNKENWSGSLNSGLSDIDDVQARRAKPFEAIPLKYTPLNAPGPSSAKKSRSLNVNGRQKMNCGTDESKCWMSMNHQPNCPLASVPWQISHKLHLLEKGGIALYYLADNAFCQGHYGTALRYLEMILMCLEGMESLNANCEQFTVNVNLMPNCLGLAGDVHYMLAKFQKNTDIYVKEFEEKPEGWHTLFVATAQDDVYYSNLDSVWQMNKSIEEHLLLSVYCYKEALACDGDCDDKLHQRLGNSLNELGVMYMHTAKTLYEQTDDVTKEIYSLWKKSTECLNGGVDSFSTVNDKMNIALLSSNLGRLMRLCAHCEAPKPQKEFSQKERRYFQKALSYYETAIAALEGENRNTPIWESVIWDYSTALFNMATLLQDFAPLSSKAQEDVEKEVTSLLTRALKYCEGDLASAKQPVYQYRAAVIYHRLASLHHHALRNQMTDDMHKHKILRLEAEEYYNRAAQLFAILERVSDCLRVQLEHVGMHEYLLQAKPSGPARIKLLRHILDLILNTDAILSTLSPKKKDEEATATKEDDDDAELQKLVDILQTRLQTVLLSLVKAHKNDSQLELYKRLYRLSLTTTEPKTSFQVMLIAIQKVKETLDNPDAMSPHKVP